MKYLVIDDDAVDSKTKIAAYHALASACKELKLPFITIKWFVHARYTADYSGKILDTFEHDDDIRGVFKGTEPGNIYVHALQLEEDIKVTVYHESYHAFQRHKGFRMGEELAYEFGVKLTANIRAYEQDDSVYLDFMAGKDWSVPEPQKERKQGDTPAAWGRPLQKGMSEQLEGNVQGGLSSPRTQGVKGQKLTKYGHIVQR